MSSRTFFLAILLILTVATSSAQAPVIETSKTKSDVREAIFRYMFGTYNYGFHVKVFCIQPDVLLPDSFVRKFANNKPRVVWASDCQIGSPMNSIHDSRAGEPGIRMSILFLRWISTKEAEVQVEAFSDGIAANWNTLRVVLTNGHWVIANDKLDSVS